MLNIVAAKPMILNIILPALYPRLYYTVIVAKYQRLPVVFPLAVVEEIGIFREIVLSSNVKCEC